MGSASSKSQAASGQNRKSESSSPGYTINLKILIRGRRGIGKTCLLNVICGDGFDAGYKPTPQIDCRSFYWSDSQAAANDISVPTGAEIANDSLSGVGVWTEEREAVPVRMDVWDVVEEGFVPQLHTEHGSVMSFLNRLRSGSSTKQDRGCNAGKGGGSKDVADASTVDVYRHATVLVVLYDVTSLASLMTARDILAGVPAERAASIRVLVIGTHFDSPVPHACPFSAAAEGDESVESAMAACPVPRSKIAHLVVSLSHDYGVHLVRQWVAACVVAARRDALLARASVLTAALTEQLSIFEEGCAMQSPEAYLEQVNPRKRVSSADTAAREVPPVSVPVASRHSPASTSIPASPAVPPAASGSVGGSTDAPASTVRKSLISPPGGFSKLSSLNPFAKKAKGKIDVDMAKESVATKPPKAVTPIFAEEVGDGDYGDNDLDAFFGDISDGSHADSSSDGDATPREQLANPTIQHQSNEYPSSEEEDVPCAAPFASVTAANPPSPPQITRSPEMSPARMSLSAALPSPTASPPSERLFGLPAAVGPPVDQSSDEELPVKPRVETAPLPDVTTAPGAALPEKPRDTRPTAAAPEGDWDWNPDSNASFGQGNNPSFDRIHSAAGPLAALAPQGALEDFLDDDAEPAGRASAAAATSESEEADVPNAVLSSLPEESIRAISSHGELPLVTSKSKPADPLDQPTSAIDSKPPSVSDFNFNFESPAPVSRVLAPSNPVLSAAAQAAIAAAMAECETGLNSAEPGDKPKKSKEKKDKEKSKESKEKKKKKKEKKEKKEKAKDRSPKAANFYDGYDSNGSGYASSGNKSTGFAEM